MPKRLLLVSLTAALLIGSACTGAKVIVASPQHIDEPTQAPAVAPENVAGFAFIAQPHFQYIFAPEEIVIGDVAPPPTDVQKATKELASQVQPNDRLKITVLPSTTGTVALAFEETSTEQQQWGGIMVPQERRLFARFAADKTLGDWLIVLDDVIVSNGKDPVPLTAYRWPRSAVEAYAACGIPAQFLIDDCTHTFYSASDVMFVVRGRGGGGAGQ
jgi:hypothetical protein